MIKRMVYTNDMEIQSLAIGSVADIGDVYKASPNSRVLAVQKEGPAFEEDVYQFEDFSIFSLKNPPPPPPLNVETFTYQNSPITVDNVRVIGVSTAGIFQTGGIEHIEALNYTKHFRILKDEP
ncbi:spore germination protein GerPE [Halobacillus litoralis]|uniref:spore germination protein GerPE n=1 Tax=Halobacillus litoralis TaxID=45668 RepID=UPI00136EEEC4|nr:spore germination protein GerPE [Halobacillus litoralis]MYL38596.1 spore germination protein GerPE [Halobacillus litoralis]